MKEDSDNGSTGESAEEFLREQRTADKIRLLQAKEGLIIPEFLKTFDPQAKLQTENSGLFSSLIQLLNLCVQRDQTYANIIENSETAGKTDLYTVNQLFFRILRARDIGTIDEKKGFVQEGDIFTTDVDAFSRRLDTPRISGFISNGRANIIIDPNNKYESTFNSSVLSTAEQILFGEDGSIRGLRRGGDDGPLNREEQRELEGLLRNLTGVVNRRMLEEQHLLD